MGRGNSIIGALKGNLTEQQGPLFGRSSTDAHEHSDVRDANNVFSRDVPGSVSNPPRNQVSGSDTAHDQSTQPATRTSDEVATDANTHKHNTYLPAGTGPGTTGKPGVGAPRAAVAGAVGGSKVVKKMHPQGKSIEQTDAQSFIDHPSTPGRDSMPTGKTIEDSLQLNPITHEHVRHVETEEVVRVKERERHIHHIQHHTQPVISKNELDEQHHDFIHPITRVYEKHANKPEDKVLLNGLVQQHRDTVHHGEKERIIVDKGVTINEHTHHHIHHIIQPVIEKETVDKHRIHTTIPIHEVTHEAPIVHQSQSHAPIAIEHFLSKGGTLDGAVPHDQIGSKVLHAGDNTRDVEGLAENLERELRLGSNDSTSTDYPSPGPKFVEQISSV
ncbi:hypothetical protein AMATHDRAFT_48838 [Amanita thiersii Skay4041]|uniref:Allergen n=1 Tax=Amanita thiersii Skay4041 TaxID=703135 RepID=A0A2A9NE39_9AGAR|nr:hypothetical protein AMATHDRAFT_48838 [Amanita thiersii Skay4041]